MKQLFFILQLIALTSWVSAQQPKSGKPYIKTWKISEQFAVVDSIPVDTAHLNFTNSGLIDRFSIANSYNGNILSPIQSKIYFDRPDNQDFIFSNSYFPYLMNVQHATFYNTKQPYSNLNYTTGGTTFRDQDNIKFLFTGNANKKLNFGTTLDYTESPGEYSNQSAKRFSGSLFGSYDGKHYSATGLMATNKIKNFESGGLLDMNSINSPIARKDLGTKINGFSAYSQQQIYYNHQYTIGIERPIRINADSVRMEYVPVTKFAHTFNYNNLKKRYFENSVEKNFYTNTYELGTQTKDTASLLSVKNNFSISMEEEFNKWMQFGLTAYIENDIQRYGFEKDSLFNSELLSSTKIGGILSKQRGRLFKYNILSEINTIGYKAGDFLLKANIGGYFKVWNDSITLVAKGFIRSDKPSYFYNYYESNHFRWKNNFDNTFRTQIGGLFSIPTRSFSANIKVENITNYVYFNSEALPKQYAANIQVLSGDFKLDLHVGKFTLENNAVYQVSSNQNILALPTLALYHNLYFNDILFKVLSIQLGANVRYHTAYYAPSYMPATGQFYNQSTVKIGNYPVGSIYANLHLKRTRFYLEYYHINQKFMTGDYFSMPNYPTNPAIIKLGISWNFYD